MPLSVLQLLVKEARMVSPQGDEAIRARLDAKAQALGEARGVIGNPSQVRMSQAPKAQGAAAVAPGLIEKEIQKSHSIGLPKQMAQRGRRGFKAFLGGKGGLGSAFKNRAALAGAGIAGLGGLAAYLGSEHSKNAPSRQPDEVPPQGKTYPLPQPSTGYLPDTPQQAQQYPMGQEAQRGQFDDAQLMQILQSMYPGFSQDTFGKMSAYSPTAAGTPPPPVSPKVTAPGPSVAGIPTIKPGEPPSGLKLPGKAPKAPSTGAPKAPSVPKIAESDATLPLAAAGVGGVGGYALGDKLLAPFLKTRERLMAAKIKNMQDALQGVKATKTHAPAVMAATGALLLAALTALAIKNKQENKTPNYSAMQNYDQSGAGFHPTDYRQFGSY